MRLDVVLPTFNRSLLLQQCLASLQKAIIPIGLEIGVTVVDNNSSDDTAEAVRALQPAWAGRLQYVFEKKKGKSYALNSGIGATKGDLVGFVDDDEEVHEAWFTSVLSAFKPGELDFIGGPCVPRFETEPHAWLPKRWVPLFAGPDMGEKQLAYDKNCPGIMPGGNAVITRAMLEKVGGYSPELGPTRNSRLMGCEDDDMYRRLIKAGARGRYIPELIIYHHIPASRLTKRYLRSVVFWRGASLAVLNRKFPETVRHFLRVPLYRYGNVLRAFRGLVRTGFLDPSQRFSIELEFRHLAGFFWGMNFMRHSS